MEMKNRLRNSIVRKIQQLSSDKLTEIDEVLSQIENQALSKSKTLSLAGSWKTLEEDFFTEWTENLHKNRANDREILLPLRKPL